MKVKLPGHLTKPDELFYFNDPNKIAWNFRHEFLLNNVNGRGASFTAKHKVGPTSHLINSCNPLSYSDWVDYYFENAIEEKVGGKKVTVETFSELGFGLKERMRKIFEENMKEKIPNIPDQVYAAFIYNLTINRTWDGYVGEKTVESLIEEHFKIKVNDSKEFENQYLVDKFIDIGSYKIGFQVKPDSFLYDHLISTAHVVKHKSFEDKYGGKVFFVHYNHKFGVINSNELIQKLTEEIQRLYKKA
jgi:uncharacterized protein YggL (DUF469 family)